MPTRREKIEAMLEKDPNDAFLRYGLSQELDKAGEHERSLALLAELRRHQPPYVSAFFMAAQQLVRLSRVDEARAVLRDGIEEARRQRNDHAAGEMSELLTQLGTLVSERDESRRHRKYRTPHPRPLSSTWRGELSGAARRR